MSISVKDVAVQPLVHNHQTTKLDDILRGNFEPSIVDYAKYTIAAQAMVPPDNDD